MDETRRQAMNLALRRVSSREYGAAELAAYLEKKGIGAKVAAEVVAELVRQKFIDDSRFARVIAREQAQRGKGPGYIRQKLRTKGLELGLEEVKALYSEVSERSDLETAAQVLERRYPGYRLDKAVARRAFQALIRRGFSFETARQALRGVTGKDSEA